MKKQFKSLLALLLILTTMLALFACARVSAEGKWENATYRSDKSFGNGAKSVTVAVVVEEQRVTFTLKTDKETLADALLEHGLIEGEESAFGIYVKKVNGITADYNEDSSWWGVEQNGTLLPTGMSGILIEDGEHYDVVCKKG